MKGLTLQQIFYNLPKELEAEQYEENETFGFIDFGQTYFDFDNEKEYNAVTNLSDRLCKEYSKYKISVWYDVSGYIYWNKQKEPNYLAITVDFQKPISRKEIKALSKRIMKIKKVIGDNVMNAY